MGDLTETADLAESGEKSVSGHPEFLEVLADGGIRLNLSPPQARAWGSSARIVAVLAGTQGGKTVMGPPWLYREIQARGPGDYLAVAPTFPVMFRKQLPEFLHFYKDVLRLGRYNTNLKQFIFSRGGQQRTFGGSGMDYRTVIQFGYAEDPESLEAMTAKGAWLDEAGQRKFKLDSWHAIGRRLAVNQGRILITTTLYNLGWLHGLVWVPWENGDPHIEVIRFESRENPAFPMEEWDRMRASMPAWKFDLFYRAIPTRPAGLIYDCFDSERVIAPFKIPGRWPRYIGIDPGGVNMAALFYARDPESKRFVLYREYKAGSRTAKEHVEALLQNPVTGVAEPMPKLAVGGSAGEEQWRREFRDGGLPIRGPAVTDVEVGIDRVYGQHKRGMIDVFSTCEGYLDELGTYSRELDEEGKPTEKIADKSTFHFMDAERYIQGYLAGGGESKRRLAPISLIRRSPWKV
jgi:hypothetical protein